MCVITLYAAQRVQLQGRVPPGVQVDTVDAYQGRECDYVIISLVRSNTTHAIGHGGDPRRMNVALTRARRGLVVIGDISTFAECALWKDFFSTFSSCIVAASVTNSGVSLSPISSTLVVTEMVPATAMTLQQFVSIWDGRYDSLEPGQRLRSDERSVKALDPLRHTYTDPAPPRGTRWTFSWNLPPGGRRIHNDYLEKLLFSNQKQPFMPSVQLSPDVLPRRSFNPGNYVARRFKNSLGCYIVDGTALPCDTVRSSIAELVALLVTVESRCHTDRFEDVAQSCDLTTERLEEYDFDDEFHIAADSALAYAGFSAQDMLPETSPLEWVHASLRVDVHSELAGSSKSTGALAVRAEGKKGHTYTLAAISRIQCVWRTRIVGYYCSSAVRTYWRLANSSRGRCDAASLRDLSQGCKACPFCNFHALRISAPTRSSATSKPLLVSSIVPFARSLPLFPVFRYVVPLPARVTSSLLSLNATLDMWSALALAPGNCVVSPTSSKLCPVVSSPSPLALVVGQSVALISVYLRTTRILSISPNVTPSFSIRL